MIAIGTGPGVVLVLRWFWWRVNAAAELAAMLSGFLVGFSTSVVPLLRIDDYGVRLMVTTGLSALIWLGVLLVTPPESPEVLERFVQQVNPPGPGWKRWRQRLGIQPLEGLDRLLAALCSAQACSLADCWPPVAFCCINSAPVDLFGDCSSLSSALTA